VFGADQTALDIHRSPLRAPASFTYIGSCTESIQAPPAHKFTKMK
jgi:hypothetical protein